jgi:hypothetical protein
VLISFGEANTIEARSPCMPAPTATGWPGRGPSLLESVLKRRLNSLHFLGPAVLLEHSAVMHDQIRQTRQKYSHDETAAASKQA